MRSALLLALCSCGRIGFDSLPGGDAGADAVARGTVAVSTRGVQLQGPAIIGDVIVWSNHADGSIDDIELSVAGADTIVTVDLGGSVSAYYEGPFIPQLFTTFDVTPGDHLSTGYSYAVCQGTPRGTVTLDWPSYPGAANYLYGDVCGGAVTQATSSVWNITTGQADPYDVVVVAQDAANKLIGSTALLGTPFHDGLNLTLPAWQAAPDLTIRATDIPAGFDATLDVELEPGFVVQQRQGLPVIGGNVDATVQVPSAANPTARVTGRFTTANLERGFVAHIPAPLLTLTVLSTVFPPAVGAPAIAGDRISWTSSGGGPSNGTHVYYHQDPMFAAVPGISAQFQWWMWGPPNVQQLVLPTVPSGVMVSFPASTSFVEIDGVEINNRSWPQVRQLGELWTYPNLFAIDVEHAYTHAEAP